MATDIRKVSICKERPATLLYFGPEQRKQIDVPEFLNEYSVKPFREDTSLQDEIFEREGALEWDGAKGV